MALSPARAAKIKRIKADVLSLTLRHNSATAGNPDATISSLIQTVADHAVEQGYDDIDKIYAGMFVQIAVLGLMPELVERLMRG